MEYERTGILREQHFDKYLVLHITLLFAFWIMYEIFIAPFIKEYNLVYFNILNPSIKVLGWTVPVFVILHAAGIDKLKYLKLNNNVKKGFMWGIFISIVTVLYNITGAVVMYNNIGFNPLFDINKWIGGVILIGFTEEVLFRGYFLQRAATNMKFWIANIVVSLLFLAIHFPIWYAKGSEVASGGMEWLCLILFVFLFSIVQGYVLKKSQSLWPCIMMHSVNNFMANALILS